MMRRGLICLGVCVLLSTLATDAAGALAVKINFQPEGQPTPMGYLPDYGETFGDRGQGFSYGWDMDIKGDARRRSRSADPLYDTLVQMQERGPRTWEIELPRGGYKVFVACGDPAYDDQINNLDVEGTRLADPDGRDYFDEYSTTVMVSDGRMTIKPASDGTKCKLLFLQITRVEVLKAFHPVPGSGSTYSDSWVTLSWSAGDHAALHKIYFSDRITDIFLGVPAALLGTQAETSFVIGQEGAPYPGGLVPGKTYYWRIDEVNDLRPGSPWKGDLWNFKVPLGAAYNPDPRDGAEYVDPKVTLSWTAGFGAKSHTVYIGDDFNDVNEAADGQAQTTTTYAPGALAKGTVHYWRVDEFDGVNTYRGPIWRFTTIPSVPVTDPNLLCWWKFDEIPGGAVIDSSGYDHFGQVRGASLESQGRVGSALRFGGDGDCVVDEDAEDYLNGLNALTVCMWIQADEVGTDRGFIDCEEPDGSDQMITMRHDLAGASYGGSNVFKIAITSTGGWQQQLESSSNVQTAQWQHVAMTWSTGKALRFYIDGVENTPTGTSDPNTTGVIEGCTKMVVGKGGKDQGAVGWKGLIDDVRIYNIVLSDEDIRQVMRGESDLAWDPSPQNGSTPDLQRALPLAWKAGENTLEHDVYFGLDRDAVAACDTSDKTGIYRGRQAGTDYTPPEGVAWDSGPYYWRVDEFNTDGTTTRGRLWQFTVADFILVDDFEAYNDLNLDEEGSNRIYATWIDGWGTQTNGAVVGYATPDFAAGGHFVETEVVHGGRQSMPYLYNTAVGYSEAVMSLTYPRDWSEQAVKALTLWFRGYPAGLVEEPAGTYTISASGADIAGTMDEFRYVHHTLSGPGSIQARVLNVQNTHGWAKAGVMIRETVHPSAPFAAVYITPGYGCRFQTRPFTFGEIMSDSPVATVEQNAIAAPYWVKLERDAASTFRGYYSANGITWTPMAWNPQSINMIGDVCIGLALTSHNPNAICKAQFSDVKITGQVTSQTWTNEAVGVEMPGNDAAPMYVAIANKNAPAAAVYHPDPKAAQLDAWTPWTIDLKAFSDLGVKLTDVDSIAIGFGDKSNPQAGGAGKVFFDDIRLHRTE